MTTKQQAAFDAIIGLATKHGYRTQATYPRDATDGGNVVVFVLLPGAPLRYGRETIGIPTDGRALHLGGFEANESISWVKRAIKAARVEASAA